MWHSQSAKRFRCRAPLRLGTAEGPAFRTTGQSSEACRFKSKIRKLKKSMFNFCNKKLTISSYVDEEFGGSIFLKGCHGSLAPCEYATSMCHSDMVAPHVFPKTSDSWHRCQWIRWAASSSTIPPQFGNQQLHCALKHLEILGRRPWKEERDADCYALQKGFNLLTFKTSTAGDKHFA